MGVFDFLDTDRTCFFAGFAGDFFLESNFAFFLDEAEREAGMRAIKKRREKRQSYPIVFRLLY